MQRFTMYFGVGLTILVVALLVSLHLFSSPEVPRFAAQKITLPDVFVCQDEVPWVTEPVIQKARMFWREHGHPVGPTRLVPCASLESCPTSEKNPRMLPCSRGNMVVTLQDQAFSEEHLGETVSMTKGGDIAWATILLPPKLLVPEGTPSEQGMPVFPPDVEALLLAHEMGHWFGYDHVRTVLAGSVVAEPSGHLMTKSVFKMGWRDAGLPKP